MRIRILDLPVDLQLKLFDSTVLPILLYSADIWRFEDQKRMETLHNQFLRSISTRGKVHPDTCSMASWVDYPLEIYIKTKMVWFGVNCSQTNSQNCHIFYIHRILDQNGSSRSSIYLMTADYQNFGPTRSLTRISPIGLNWFSKIESFKNGMQT